MDTKPDSNLENEIQQVLADAPKPIRDFFAARKTGVVTKNLMQKYQLHVDQAAILEREIILLLLGLEDPKEFSDMLTQEAHIDPRAINSIMLDINAQIFVPLREEMRKGGGSQVSSSEQKTTTPPSLKAMEGTARTTIISANPQLPTRPAPTLASVPRYVPPKKYFNLQNKIPPAPPKATQGTAPPVPTPPIQPVQPQRRDVIPAPAETKLLEDHEEPHIEFSKTPMPAKTAPPPLNLPGVIQPPVIPDAQPSPVIPKVEPQPKPVVPIAPYSADPYREPIEP